MTQTNEKGANPAETPSSEQPVEDSSLSIPQLILQQADAVASAAVSDAVPSHAFETFPPLEDVPPPPYSAENYGEVDISQNGFNTGAKVAKDGRVDIKIDQVNRRLSDLLARSLASYEEAPQPEPQIPEGLGSTSGLPCPPLNVVIHVVGSRGDVQPFVALGKVLKNKFNHRVRLATHPVFRDFVTEHGLEFFSIGGDPAELMAFMVKNPGLIPGIEALKSGDIGKRRKGIYEIINGCWRSCIEPGDGTGPSASDDVLEGRSIDNAVSLGDSSAKPFVADAIIANPPSFAHIHIAEKLGIPLHLMFTMPWSPTQAYPHPLANIVSSNTDAGMTNFLSYIMVDLLTWQGIGDVINRFREKALHLEPISVIWAPGSLHRLRIPWTYAWSPALIPMPKDWRNFIDISGFFFLDLATNYTPDHELAAFLDAGPPPVYIGFGSIVVDDPNAMTKLIFEAVRITGQRALVSKGWGGLAADELGQPDGVMMLGNCPHDWLFERVSAVVHHGGAGTTAAGVKAGRPTVVVPFFGDQAFWGNMVNQAGAGPKPIHHKELTAQKLADAINEALKPASLSKAKELSAKIKNENGPSDGADTFHKRLNIPDLRCSICPGRAAVWSVKKTRIRLSALAATVLANEGLVEFSDLRLYRSREYEVDTGPPEPISGGAAALVGTIGSITAGVADFPTEVLRSFKSNTESRKNGQSTSGTSTPKPSSARTSAASLTSETSMERIESSGSSLKPTKESQSVSSLDDESERGRSGDQTPTSAMSSVLSPDGTARRGSQNRARSCSQDAMKFTSESAVSSAKAAGNIVAIGLKSPLDFTMSLAKGFHNAPRLYNDKTVRPSEKVTGFQSGLKAAGKNFAFGFMDGIGGLVTQPMQGYKDEGGAGLVKGFMKGSLGLVVKPGAAIWGIPAYTMQGVYAEITKNFGKSTTNYIIAARMAQGYDDFKQSGEGERERILSTWQSGSLVNEYRRKKRGKQKSVSEGRPTAVSADSSNKDRLVDSDGQLLSGFRNTMGLSWDERKELSRRKQEQEQNQRQSSSSDEPIPTEAEFEAAIRTAVEQTSQNDPEEDRAIEAAIRASVRELQQSQNAGTIHTADDNDEAYQRAVRASMAEYKRAQTEYPGQETGIVDSSASDQIGHRIQMHDDDPATDDDEDYKKALAESMKSVDAGKSQNKSGSASSRPPALPDRGAGLSYQRQQQQQHQQQHDNNDDDSEDDADLREALRLSQQEGQQKEEELSKQKTEEEIVLEYVKKQSLQEEEYRQKRAAGGGQ